MAQPYHQAPARVVPVSTKLSINYNGIMQQDVNTRLYREGHVKIAHPVVKGLVPAVV